MLVHALAEILIPKPNLLQLRLLHIALSQNLLFWELGITECEWTDNILGSSASHMVLPCFVEGKKPRMSFGLEEEGNVAFWGGE